MSILHSSAIQPIKHYRIENLFSLSLSHNLDLTSITMVMHTEIFSTSKLPATYKILKKHLPQIFISKCFNDDKLPFSVEVRRTEIGHLFEHILLEYLCQQKFLKGFDYAEFSGETNWNWIEEPMGIFHIQISAGIQDADLFPEAMEKAIKLVHMIILGSDQLPAELPVLTTDTPSVYK
jgi:hypothetical protein